MYGDRGAKSRIVDFLARRCAKEFLLFYIEEHPTCRPAWRNPASCRAWVPEVDLAARLHKFDPPPEAQRLKFLETVTGYALRGEGSPRPQRLRYQVDIHRRGIRGLPPAGPK